jgi:hypothetical protein
MFWGGELVQTTNRGLEEKDQDHDESIYCLTFFVLERAVLSGSSPLLLFISPSSAGTSLVRHETSSYFTHIVYYTILEKSS